MEKISKKLYNEASDKPEELFEILIVLNHKDDVKEIPLAMFKTYMGTILSATVTGSEIIMLSKMKCVTSIEVDGEVTAW